MSRLHDSATTNAETGPARPWRQRRLDDVGRLALPTPRRQARRPVRSLRATASWRSISLEFCPPPPEQYRALCASVGWRVPPVGETIRALAGSQAVVGAHTDDGELVGLGRLVGDGALHWCIVDVMVDPRFQRQGIGKRIIDELEKVVVRSGNGAVALVAAPEVVRFYERIGYRRSANSWMVRRIADPRSK